MAWRGQNDFYEQDPRLTCTGVSPWALRAQECLATMGRPTEGRPYSFISRSPSV
jgi:hypothetical protein